MLGKHRGRPDVGTSLAWILPRKLASIDDSNPITATKEKKDAAISKGCIIRNSNRTKQGLATIRDRLSNSAKE